MDGLAASPFRNLISVILFVMAVIVMATGAYMAVGWSFLDAFYMVLMTVYTVGYEEVRPINTPFLHVVTISTIVLGCTGMIMVTGALVQVFTFSQIQQLLGANRVKTEIKNLKDHVIICGFGRIGVMLAKELSAGEADFVVLERDDGRLNQALELGYLCWQGDATDEGALRAVGVDKARVLATVLPNDAANVFITLSARALNPALKIIARGEEPTTEGKLIQAGANKVVLPTHIGAERIAEMILFPETARFIRGTDRMRDFEKVLRDLGMEIDVAVAAEKSAVAGLNIRQLEDKARGAFLVVQINRHDGEVITRPSGDVLIHPGDGLVIVGKAGADAKAIFSAPAERVRAGRTFF